MTKKTVVIIVALTLIISLFTGCQDNLIERLEKVQAHITISVKLPDALKIEDVTDPNYFDPDTFVFTLTWYSTSDITKTTAESFPYTENLAVVYKFDPGEYTFELEGVINKGTVTEEVKAYGKRTIAIERGQRDKLEIPLTYYIYSKQGGFTVEGGVITLSGKLELEKNETISIPSDMKLVIEDGCTIDVGGTGSTLTFDGGAVEALGDLTVKGNLALTGSGDLLVNGDLYLEADNATLTIDDGLTLTVDGNVYTEGDLSLFGEGKLIVNGNLSVENNLTANDEQLKVGGEMSYNYLISEDNPELLVVYVGEGETRDLASIGEGYTSIKVTGGGTLTYTGSTPLKLEAVGLEDGSTLQVGADGALECDIITGEGSLKAMSITADTVETRVGEKLTLTGAVTTDMIEGDGSLEVVGDLVLTTEDTTLTIAYGATMSVTGDVAAPGTLTVSGYGSMNIDGELTVDKDLTVNAAGVSVGFLLLKTKAGETSTLTIDNAGSLTIKYAGDTTVDKVVLEDGTLLDVTGTLQSKTISGDGTLKADSIVTESIKTEAGDKLTLTGAVTTGSINGGGSLEVIGNLEFTAGATVSFDDGAELTVTGNVTAKGDLTISGGGTLKAGDLTAEGKFTTEAKVNIDSLTSATGKTLDLEITKGGSLTITDDAKDSNIHEVNLSGDATMNVAGTLKSSTISGDGTLMAASIEADTIKTATNGTLTLDSTTNAPIAVTTVTGNGTVKVADVVATGELSISGGATLEASGLSVAGDTLKITGSGALKVTDNTNLSDKDIVLAGGSILEVSGTLESTSISGDGTLKAGSIYADTIKTEADNTLTFNSYVTTGEISGDGNLEAWKIVGGTDGEIEIKGSPTVKGDLSLEDNTTISFAENATLTVEGDVKAYGSLEIKVTTENKGKLNAENVMVEDTLTYEGGTIYVGEGEDEGIITSGDYPLGTKADLKVYITGVTPLVLPDVLDYGETLTVIGGGTLQVTGITTTLKTITLEDGSTLQVNSSLSLSANASVTLSDNATLTVDGPLSAVSNLTISGSGTVKASTIVVDTIHTTASGDLNLDSGAIPITVTTVTGDGTASIVGPAKVKDLAIAKDATLEASGLNIEKVGDDKTLAITGGGTLVDTSGTDLNLDEVALADGSTLEVKDKLTSTTISGEGTVKAGSIDVNTIATTAGKTITLEGDVKVTQVTVSESSTAAVKVNGALQVNKSTDELAIKVAKGATLEVKSLDPEIKSLTVTGGGILKITDEKIPTTLDKIVLTAGSTLEIAGSLTENNTTAIDFSGEGKVVAKGEVTATDLNIGLGTTLDISNSSAKLNISGDATVAGVLDLGSGGWDSVVFIGTDGTITLSGDAELKINNQLKWYTLHNGAKAQYFKQDGVVQIRFLECTGTMKVTPRITGITPTEPIVRVGDKALFEVTDIYKLNLKAVQLILEPGSTTKIGESWWNAGTTLVFSNGGSVTANAGAIVTHDKWTWIGNGTGEEKTPGEWNLTGKTQLKYDGTITTVTGAGQLEINDWKGRDWTAANKLIRGLVHTMVIEENANVRFNIPYFNIFDKGKILIEEGGSVEIPGGSELKASVANGIVIKGTLTVYDGGTVNIKEKAFFFDGTDTGQVFLKSGGIYSVSGVMYFAPPVSKVSGSRSSLWFQTENVDLTFTFDTKSNTFLMKNYIIDPSKVGGTFTIVSSTVTLINHRITVGAGSTLTLGSSLSTLTLGDKVEAMIVVKDGGRIKNNKTISISSKGTLYLEKEAITCGKKPSGTITGDGTWNTQACD